MSYFSGTTAAGTVVLWVKRGCTTHSRAHTLRTADSTRGQAAVSCSTLSDPPAPTEAGSTNPGAFHEKIMTPPLPSGQAGGAGWGAGDKALSPCLGTPASALTEPLLFLPAAMPPQLPGPSPTYLRRHQQPAPCVPRPHSPTPQHCLPLAHQRGPGQHSRHREGAGARRVHTQPLPRQGGSCGACQAPYGRPLPQTVPEEGLPELSRLRHALAKVPGRAPREGAAAGRAGATAPAGRQGGEQVSAAPGCLPQGLASGLVWFCG